MTAPKRNAAGLSGARGADGSKGNNSTAKRIGHRPEYQGKANDRNADQRPPVWPEPPEAAAFRILDLHWGRK